MPTSYIQISVRNIRSSRDGALVVTTGRFRRFLSSAELVDRDATLDLIGEPFDFAPIHDTAIEAWGQLRLGTRPHLLLHDARPLNGERRVLPAVRTPLPGEAATLLARVTLLGGVRLATTPHHHTFVLTGALPPVGLHELTGYVLSLTPPVFDVTVARSAAHSAVPETPLPGGP